MKKLTLFSVLILLLASLFLLFTSVSAQQDSPPTAVAGGDPPTILVPEDVANITVQGAKVWWWYTLGCAPTQSAPEGNIRVEEIARIATTGGLTRSVFAHDVASPYCGQWQAELLSNVEADDDYLYWISDDKGGLVRLSVEANIGDEPTLFYSGQDHASQIAERGNYIYLMHQDYGIIRVNKSNGSSQTIVTPVQLGGASTKLQVSNDYVFWTQGTFLKVAYNSGGGGTGITTGVSGYIAQNSLCPVDGTCYINDQVFIGIGQQIVRYNVDTDTFSGVLYNSPFAGANVRDITVDGTYLYFFEERAVSCEPFCTYSYGLYRMNKTGGPVDLLYFLDEHIFGAQRFNLTLGGPNNDYLFWRDSGALKRLPRNAAAIPSVDIAITDVEVTQAIQDLDQSIPLIQGKRTGVRVHVDAAGQNVAGVTAQLYRINSVGSIIDGPIFPTSGTYHLTVPNNPSRANFNHAFYFELPHDWIDGSNIRLRAIVNPTQIPPEPTFTNNTQSTAVLTLHPSPTLRTQLLVWGYTVDGTFYQGDPWQDVYQARSWIHRTYPLAYSTGGYLSPDPGFRLKIRYLDDDNLGDEVERISDDCLDRPEDKREFCAATYTNNWAQWLRATENIPNDEMIYSMIWEEPGLPFPRGFATGNVSAGPTGRGTWGWDNDGSYGDWYMGHEVGHNAGRGHPSQGNGCGHSASDDNYPHIGAAIGVGEMWGFDVGHRGLNPLLTPRVYPGNIWRDMMSYCDNQWISDYTYEGIYDFLTAVNRDQPATPTQAVRAGSDTLALFGTIHNDENLALFQLTGLWDSPGPYSPPTGSQFRVRLLDSGANELAYYDLDGEASHSDPDFLAFTAVVPFALSTTQVELRRLSDDQLLGVHTISANAPTISNVTLVGAPSPVVGPVTLQWQASDADGDPLTFDVYYTADGSHYTAFALGVSGNSIELETSQMPGSNNGRFRVTASDGTRLAEAESAPFVMASKAPSVMIVSPEDGKEVTYGTAVDFIGEAEDLQAHLPNSSLTWRLNGVSTGVTGPYYTAELLPVGSHVVTFRAQNSAGQVSTASVTVVVNDDLEYAGPNLVVGPDQVSWQVEPDDHSFQYQVVTIGNMGTGTITWTASENADWLALSSESGQTPSTITINVYPESLPADTIFSTMVTISGNNGQTVQIPVTYVKGMNPFWSDNPHYGGAYKLFLPIIRR